MSPPGAYQFACFRFLSGVALYFFFISLNPFAPELSTPLRIGPPLSDWGVPNIVDHLTDLAQVRRFQLIGAITAGLMALGLFRRILAAILLYCYWASLGAITLVPTPFNGFLPWLLLVCALAPAGEALALRLRRRRRLAGDDWSFPLPLQVLLAAIVGLSALGHVGFFGLLDRIWLGNDMATATELLLLGLFFVPLFLFDERRRWLFWLISVSMLIPLLLVTAGWASAAGMLAVLVLLLDSQTWFPWSNSTGKGIVFIDGSCILCHGLAEFLLRQEKSGRIKLATLQGQTASRLLPEDLRKDLQTVVLYQDGQYFTRSTAVLRLMLFLPGIWSLSILGWLIPRGLRDWVYKLVAQSRYRLFGKLETCRLPAAEDRRRILD